MRRAKSAFSLIELLVATALSGVLMASVLMVLAGVSRDRQRLLKDESQPHSQALMDRLKWDFVNARTMRQAPDGQTLILIGHDGIDPQTLTSNGRLTRVVYRCLNDGKISFLVREQEYLDDPVHPNPWRELAATGVTSVMATPETIDMPAPDGLDDAAGPSLSELARGIKETGDIVRVPGHVQVHIESVSGGADERLWIK